jgi:hypothetical protein
MIELQLLLGTFAAWSNRQQAGVIAYPIEENRILSWATFVRTHAHLIATYVGHCHDERSHQGLENEIPARPLMRREGSIHVGERLGGLLKYYHRAAA